METGELALTTKTYDGSGAGILAAMDRDPEEVIAEASKAAAALRRVIERKPKPVIIRGEQYLEYEDWATIGQFYKIPALVEWTREITIGEAHGFEARATAVHVPTGQRVSAAEAMCLNDEDTWAGKPLNQLRSNAQTRACAKALRNCLSWVAVLAGYRPTPAEEMTKDDFVPEHEKTQTDDPQHVDRPGESPDDLTWIMRWCGLAAPTTLVAALSSFRDKEGKIFMGKSSLALLSEKHRQITERKIAKLRQEIEAGHVDRDANAVLAMAREIAGI